MVGGHALPRARKRLGRALGLSVSGVPEGQSAIPRRERQRGTKSQGHGLNARLTSFVKKKKKIRGWGLTKAVLGSVPGDTNEEAFRELYSSFSPAKAGRPPTIDHNMPYWDKES